MKHRDPAEGNFGRFTTATTERQYRQAPRSDGGLARDLFYRRDPTEQPIRPGQNSVVRFAAVGSVVMQGQTCIAKAKSGTMARRIANALNSYTPNRKGV